MHLRYKEKTHEKPIPSIDRLLFDFLLLQIKAVDYGIVHFFKFLWVLQVVIVGNF
jgi:hypothetical protein